ncbi:MAG: class I SAM-dependent methyltransferase [Pseudomonadota bacterium]
MAKGSHLKAVDKHELYQKSVQNPEFELDFIEKTFREIRNRRPYAMREDFCGTALSSCEWVARSPQNHAHAYDIDTEVLDWGRANNARDLTPKQQARLSIENCNVLSVRQSNFDACQAFNFSYWIFQERKQLLKYFRNVHRSLCTDGVFFMDAFGGFEAHKTQKEKREVDGFHYIWEQEQYNAATAEMHCKIHFQLDNGKKLRNAFSYVWRLWGAKEIREALIDAGFSKTVLYLQEFDDETDEPLDSFVATDFAEDYACWVGYIVAIK